MQLEVKHLPDRLANKLQYFKKQYASGLLTNEQINSLKKENLIHLFYNKEQLSNENTKKVCEFHKINNRLPSTRAKDREEKKLASFINTRRQAKKGLSKFKFYESDQKVLEFYGLPTIFGSIAIDTEKLSNENTIKVCEFYKTNNRLPSRYTKDEEEKKLGEFISHRRQAKKGLGKSKFYKSDQKIAESYGLPHLFEEIDPEQLSNQRTIKVCKFYNTNNRLPSGKAKDEEEKKLGAFLYNRRQAKKGVGNRRKFYESDQKIAESYGLPHLFDTKDKA
jgi:hypothetical protein